MKLPLLNVVWGFAALICLWPLNLLGSGPETGSPPMSLQNTPLKPKSSRSSLSWTITAKRDPFHAPIQSRLPAVSAVTLKLQAIWMQPGVRLAIINGVIVKEGDQIGGCRVREIRSTEVLLMSPTGIQTLQFESK